MQGFLKITFLHRFIPNCCASNFTTFANKQITFTQPKTRKIRRSHFDNTKIAKFNPPPLHMSVTHIEFWHTYVLFNIKHFAKLN